MRTEEEMFQLIMDVAKTRRTHSSCGNGGFSHECEKRQKDSFQDFDIVYIVEPCAEFLKQQRG